MMIVRVILVDTTRPLRMRPRMETSPVKGHFLSTARVRICPIVATNEHAHTDVSALNRLRGGLEAKANILVPPLLFGRNLLA